MRRSQPEYRALVRTTPAFWLLLGCVVCGLVVSSNWTWPAAATAPPVRPKAVPESAIWIGGLDGGDFYQCTLSVTLECTIFNDFSGDVEKRGIVGLTEWQKLKYKSVADVYADLNFFDGERLHFASRTTSTLK